MKKLIIVVACATLGVTTSGLLAQTGSVRLVPPSSSAVKFAQPWRPAGVGGETLIVGTVIDIGQVPVSYARVQLRDLETGNLLASDETNAFGEYEFKQVEPGLYVVEMLTVDNYVLALSKAGSLKRYETLNTVVQLPGRWDFGSRKMFPAVGAAAFFGMGSANTMTSATLGLAVDSQVRPVNAGEPVSPQ